MEELENLQSWFVSQCDGNYEHSSGIILQTIDNPGWMLIVHLNGTNLQLPDEPWHYLVQGDVEWMAYKVTDNVFDAAGDPSKLKALVSLFLEKVKNA